MDTFAGENYANPTRAAEGTAPAQGQGQYSIWQIVGIWLAGGAPLWIFSWAVFPLLSHNRPAADAALLRFHLLTVGLAWQFALALLIIYREEGNLRFETVRRRVWLQNPVSPKNGRVNHRLWFLVIPLIVLVAAIQMGLAPFLNDLWITVFPFFAEPPGYEMSHLFTPELRSQWIGAWGLLAAFAVNAVFNTFLGEEFLFRGVLLPKMNGVFGRWDWVVNGILFGLYHLHKPWGILTSICTGLVYAFTGKQFNSNWFPIILHSGQSIYFIVLILGLVLGLA